MHEKWKESAVDNSLENRTAELMNLVIHFSLDFLNKFNSSEKKRPWGQLKLVYKPVVRATGRRCNRRAPVFRYASGLSLLRIVIISALEGAISHWQCIVI